MPNRRRVCLYDINIKIESKATVVYECLKCRRAAITRAVILGTLYSVFDRRVMILTFECVLTNGILIEIYKETNLYTPKSESMTVNCTNRLITQLLGTRTKYNCETNKQKYDSICFYDLPI